MRFTTAVQNQLAGYHADLPRISVATGRSPCVGLVGLTLGGGIGTLQGKHGLVMDSLLSLRIATAQGEFVTVSKTEEPDLFWAMRGAGANFGIVTSATYRVHDATNNGQFVSADYEFDGASSRSLWELLKSFDHEMPPELSVVLGCGYNRAKGQVSQLSFDPRVLLLHT